MRINRLRIEGFGPYKEAQDVDFDAFADDGIFLISGKTGAGKSSILDAICFALYNSVPRYDGSEKQLRSDHCELGDPTRVTVEFTVQDSLYRVERSPEYQRPALRGGGTTTQKAEAQLEEFRDGDWVGLAARPVDVAKELGDRVGLSKEQFLQVILLAQNRFQEFLQAKSDDRGEVLRALFGTERFSNYEHAIVERSKEIERKLASSAAEGARDGERARLIVGDGFPEGAAGLEMFTYGLELVTARRDAAIVSANTARAAEQSADDAHRVLSERRKMQEKLRTALESQREFDDASEVIRDYRQQHAAALRAVAVMPSLDAHRESQSDLTAAESAEASAREEFGTTGDPSANAEKLSTIIDEKTRTLGALEGILKEETALVPLQEKRERQNENLAQLHTKIASLEGRAKVLPVDIEEEAKVRDAADLLAARATDLQATTKRLQQQLDAAREAATLTVSRRALLEAEVAASAQHTAAVDQLDQLHKQRFAGFAGELAGNLVDGEPCEVCGSAEHPHPAEATAAPVTDADIENAREYSDTRRRELEKANAQVNTNAEHIAAATARADGQPENLLTTSLASAKGDLDRATEASATSVQAATRRTKLMAEFESVTGTLADLNSEVHEEQIALTSTVGRIEDLSNRLETHRADYPTVAERVESIRARLALARALHTSIAVRREMQTSHTSALKAVKTALAEHQFDTPEAAQRASLSTAELDQIDRKIRAHEQALAVNKSVLDAPELQGLPAELIEIEGSAELLREAVLRRENSTDDVARTRANVQQYESLFATVKARFDATAEVQAEHDEIEGLAAAVQGKGSNTRKMRLETYVLAAQLEEIVAAANRRLHTMTAGRYELEHDDGVQYRKAQSGLGLAILDQHTGRSRATVSLSGGETFLASLALALGLAEVVTNQAGGITLDTLFVDEGFGSLDADTLEIAMGTLDSLRAGGRTIGLISHVDAMKEQIPAKLEIMVNDSGASMISQRALV